MKKKAKTSAFPSLRISGELRASTEVVLREGETLSAFLLEAIRYNIQRLVSHREFTKRALTARDEARKLGKYVSAVEVLAGLDRSLARSRIRYALNSLKACGLVSATEFQFH